MKLPFKLCKSRHHLATIGGLALAISTLAVLSALADDATTPIAASTTLPNASAPAKTPATAKADATDPKNVSSAAAQNTASDDLVNWVTLGVGSTFVHGNHAEFQHEQNVKNGVFGGLDDFHWEQAIGKSAQLTVDGHALVGNHDYDLKFDLTDEKLGYIRAGYTEFRTWYVGNAGFYAPTGETTSLYDNDLHIDRRSGWIETGLTLPDLPVFAFRWEYDSREGVMDSTSWGDNAAAPSTAPDVKIVPTFLGIDETRNIFQGSIADTVGKTDMGVTLRYEIDEVKDSTFIDLDPLNAPGGAGDRFVTQDDIERNDIFNVHGFQETFFDDHVIFSSGFSYVNTGTNLGGSRIYGAGYGANFSPAYAVGRNEGYLNLQGYGNTNEYVGNFNLMITPIKDLVFIPAVRVQYEGSNVSDSSLTTPPVAGSLAPYNANNWTASVAESLEARYTGFRDWSLYATTEFSEDTGNDDWNEYTAPVAPILNQDYDRLCQKYTLGANWYPLSQLNFGTQYYHQIHSYDYTNRLTNTPTSYPGYLENETFTTDDANIRATWTALPDLSFVTRYDFQYSTVDTTSIPVSLAGAPVGSSAQIQSSNTVNHIISETAVWAPLACLDLELGGSYVINRVDTPVAGSTGVNNVVLNGMNDYWTIDAGLGYEINDKTHLQVQYNYYRADDFVDNAGPATTAAGAAYPNTINTGFPYGTDTEEQNVTATVTHQINKAVTVSLKYGFYHYTDGSVGGQNDYKGHLVYASTQFRF